jgi:hypothetical protein
MWKKDTTRCLDVVRFLPTVPCFPHTSSPMSFETISLKILTIYLDNINQKPVVIPSAENYQAKILLTHYPFSKLTSKLTQKSYFSHENSPPFIS